MARDYYQKYLQGITILKSIADMEWLDFLNLHSMEKDFWSIV